MATPPLAYGTPAKGSTATAWATAILAAIGAPNSQSNVTSLTDWFNQEGGGGANNPLNTTQPGFGATNSINSLGVKSYATPADGVAATAATLKSGLYPGIVNALKSGSGLVGIDSSQVASELSTWSGGHYSTVGGSGGAAASSPSSSSPTGASSTSPAAAAAAAQGTAFLAAFNQANQTSAAGIGLNPIQDIGNAWQAIVSIFSGGGGVSIAESLAGILQTFIEIGPKVDELFHAFLWFLYPSHWVRIFCVLFGLVLLVPGFYGLMHTGTGDMYLAMGILLTTMAGILFFLGFHNVPQDVQSVGQFVGWLAEGIQSGSLPAGAGQPPVSGFGTPQTAASTTTN